MSYNRNLCITIDGEHLHPWFSQPPTDCHKTMTSTSCAFKAKKGSCRILICFVVAFQLLDSLLLFEAYIHFLHFQCLTGA